jgi:hypothetical protein
VPKNICKFKEYFLFAISIYCRIFEVGWNELQRFLVFLMERKNVEYSSAI